MFKKKAFLFAGMTGLLFAAFSTTAQQQREAPSPEMIKQMAEGMFQRMDADADGILTLEEFSDMQRRAMRRSGGEASADRPRGREGRRDASDRARRAAASASGEKPKAEAAKAREETTTSSGQKSGSESADAEPSVPAGLAARFNRMDADQSGGVTLDEVVAAMSQAQRPPPSTQ